MRNNYLTYNSEYPARYIRPALCAVLLHHHTFSRIKRSNQAIIPCGTCRYCKYPKKNRVTVTVNQKSHIARPNRQTERAFSIKHAFFSATDTRNSSLLNTKEEVTVNIMYIRLSSLRQTGFGYADSAFCLHFFCRFFLFISNMLNNLKSVTFFLFFFKKFLSFLCPLDDMPQDAAATRRPFFQALRALEVSMKSRVMLAYANRLLLSLANVIDKIGGLIPGISAGYI